MAHPLHARGRAYVVLKCVAVTAAYTHLRSYVVRAPGIRKGVSILGRACNNPTREKEGLEVIRYPFFPLLFTLGPIIKMAAVSASSHWPRPPLYRPAPLRNPCHGRTRFIVEDGPTTAYTSLHALCLASLFFFFQGSFYTRALLCARLRRVLSSRIGNTEE